MDKIEQLISLLKSNRPIWFIDIHDSNSGDLLYENINGKDILEQNDSMLDFFKSLGEKHNSTSVEITQFVKNGNRRTKHPIVIELVLEKEQSNNRNRTSKKVHQTQIMDAPANTGLFGGLTGMDMLNMHTKAARFDEVSRNVTSKDEEISNLKQLLNIQAIELNKSQALLAVADKEKELAVKEVENNQKSPLDSPIIGDLIKNLPAIVNAIKPAVSGGLSGSVQPQATNIPEWKQQFIDAIINAPDVNQELLNKLYFTIRGLLGDNKEFKEEFNVLLEVHNLLKTA